MLVIAARHSCRQHAAVFNLCRDDFQDGRAAHRRALVRPGGGDDLDFLDVLAVIGLQVVQQVFARELDFPAVDIDLAHHLPINFQVVFLLHGTGQKPEYFVQILLLEERIAFHIQLVALHVVRQATPNDRKFFQVRRAFLQADVIDRHRLPGLHA